MVAILNSRQFILASLLWVGILGAGWYLMYAARTVSRQFIIGDDSFSPNIEAAIKSLLDQNRHKTSEQRFDELKAHFPVVDAIKIKRVGLDSNYVQVLASSPLYLLGHKFVLTRSNEVFLATSFSHAAVHKLPIIHLHTNPELLTEIEPEQKIFLKHLPDFVPAEYEIHWHNLNQIILINKQNSKQHILIKYDQVLTQALFVTCDKILTEYQAHANKKCLEVIKIDLRFVGQMIVAC